MTLCLDFEFAKNKINSQQELIPFEFGYNIIHDQKIIKQNNIKLPIFFNLVGKSSIRNKNGKTIGEQPWFKKADTHNNLSKKRNLDTIYNLINAELNSLTEQYNFKDILFYDATEDTKILKQSFNLEKFNILDLKQEFEKINDKFRFWSLDRHIAKNKVSIFEDKIYSQTKTLTLPSKLLENENLAHNPLYDSLMTSFLFLKIKS